MQALAQGDGACPEPPFELLARGLLQRVGLYVFGAGAERIEIPARNREPESNLHPFFRSC